MAAGVPQAVYPAHARAELMQYIPRGINSLLDVGCGKGGFGRAVREVRGGALRLVGIEAVSAEAAVARDTNGFDTVVDGYFPEAMSTDLGRFDLIAFNDVLEHMVDPWAALEAASQYLAPGGRVLASIPSIQFAPIVLKLLAGRWDYTDDGTLDRTHLRFFTKATMCELFEQAGFAVETCVGVNRIGQSREHGMTTPARLGLSALRSALGNGQYMQFVLVGKPVEQRSTSDSDG